MEELKLNIRAIAAMQKISIERLAELSGINPEHLKSVSAGRVTMTADDIIKLAKQSGLSPFQIAY